jgi:hypothetical protein
LPGPGTLLGQDVLSRYRVEYRLADGLLILEPEPPAVTHPIYLDATRHVYLDLGWDDEPGATASAVFDTGASITVVDQAFAGSHARLFTSAGTSTGTDATGASQITPLAIMRGPLILQCRIEDLLVAIVDLHVVNATLQRPMDLILGWTATSQADWYIDHPHSRAACQPRGHSV